MWVEKATMKLWVICLGLLIACTKPNPNRCCTDEADCTASNIPVGSTCDDGLLCRGHQCIAIPCTDASACDETAPYCVSEACAAQCGDDSACPGFGQTSDRAFCVTGACASCRESTDCPGATPVCANGSCVLCTAHDECASGVCKEDGACASDAEIAFLATTGSDAGECTRTSPCSSIARAVAVTPTRAYILLAAGTYASSSAVALAGTRHVIGEAGTIITRSTPGPIIEVDLGAQATFEDIQVSGATAANSDGYGIRCGITGAPSVTLKRVTFSQNVTAGVFARNCTVTVYESTFRHNRTPFELIDGNATIDRSLFLENERGLILDSGIFTVTNNIVARNYSATSTVYGISIFTSAPGTRVEFNTVVDNSDGGAAASGAGIECNVTGMTLIWSNNIIARNKNPTQGTGCTYPGSIITGTDIAPLNFKSPDDPPYDYHLNAGSIAIDAATTSAVAHDFDGDARPQGGVRDVGADEYVP